MVAVCKQGPVVVDSAEASSLTNRTPGNCPCFWIKKPSHINWAAAPTAQGYEPGSCSPALTGTETTSCPCPNAHGLLPVVTGAIHLCCLRRRQLSHLLSKSPLGCDSDAGDISLLTQDRGCLPDRSELLTYCCECESLCLSSSLPWLCTAG